MYKRPLLSPARAAVLLLAFSIGGCDSSRELVTAPAPADAGNGSNVGPSDAAFTDSLPPDSAGTVFRTRALLEPNGNVGIPIRAGQKATFSVEVENGRCEDVTVTGPLSATLWTDIGTPCMGTRDPVALGPADSDGVLVLDLPLTPHQVIYTDEGSGVWTAHFDDNGGDGDFNDLVVTVDFSQKGHAECDGPTMRGNRVRCEIAPARGFTVIRRQAWGRGFDIDETVNSVHGNLDKYIWEGMAVAPTHVAITIEYSEAGVMKQEVFRTGFDITPRTWPQLQLKAPQTTIGLRGDMEAYPRNGVLGNASTGFVSNDFLGVRVTTAPPGGPNVGLSFVRDPLPEVPHSIVLHPALYRSLPAPAVQWYDDQNGTGSGNCTATQVTRILRTQAERHEGVVMTIPNSHWAITRAFYAGPKTPHQTLEAVYSWGPAEVLRADLWSKWVELHDVGTHRAAQRNFDLSDYPLILAALGCTLDYNASDN